MTQGNMKESFSKVIFINNVKAKIFKGIHFFFTIKSFLLAFLNFIYCEEIEVNNEICEDLYKLAHEYSTDELKSDCERFLIKEIKTENVIKHIQFAEKYDAQLLRKACLIFVVQNIDNVFRTQNFRDLETETLLEIYKLKQ